MNTEQQNQETQVPDPAPAPAPITTETKPSTEQPARPTNGKILTIPSKVLDQRLSKAREQGRKSFQQELEAKAKAAGYASWDLYEKALQRRSTPAAAKPQAQQSAPQAPPANDRQSRRDEKDKQALLEKARAHNRARANAEKRSRAAEARADSLEAEMHLRTAAVRAGVQDIDYAIHLLRTNLSGKSEKDLASFNESEFFMGLKKTHPILFSIEERPATTGPSENKKGDNTPPPPKTAAPPQAPAGGGGKDVREMSRDEYTKKLRAMGLKDPGQGF